MPSLVLIAVLGSVALAAQDLPVATSAPAFEVASVKVSATRATTGPASASSFRVSPSGIAVLTNHSLRQLIAVAYGFERRFERHSPEGGPADIMSARFDINAKVPIDLSTPERTTTQASVRASALLMLRTLLQERFTLRVHVETRQVPVYAITLARESPLGPELRPSRHDCDAVEEARRQGATVEQPRDARNRPLCAVEILRSPTASNPAGGHQMVGQVERRAGPLAALAPGIQGFVDRPLIDATGLTGNYEWQITTAMPGVDTADYPPMITASSG